MNTNTAAPSSRSAIWTGRVLSGLAAAFLTFDAVIKVARAPEALKTLGELGYPPNVLVPLGIVELVCLAIYLFPRTAVLGAVLWTGYLGGAIATHVRVGNPLLSHTLFPVYVAVFVWGGLFLRDTRVKKLVSDGA